MFLTHKWCHVLFISYQKGTRCQDFPMLLFFKIKKISNSLSNFPSLICHPFHICSLPLPPPNPTTLRFKSKTFVYTRQITSKWITSPALILLLLRKITVLLSLHSCRNWVKGLQVLSKPLPLSCFLHWIESLLSTSALWLTLMKLPRLASNLLSIPGRPWHCGPPPSFSPAARIMALYHQAQLVVRKKTRV